MRREIIILCILVRAHAYSDWIVDTSVQAVSRHVVAPGAEAHGRFLTAAGLDLSLSANQTDLGYFDYGCDPVNASLVAFRQAYGSAASFLNAAAATRSIQGRLNELSASYELLIVATTADVKVLQAALGPNAPDLFVLQDYSFTRPAGLRLIHSFIGATACLEVTNLTAFDSIMRDIHAAARTNEDGVLGLGVAYHRNRAGKVFAVLQEAYSDPYHMQMHGAAVMPQHGAALARCTNATCARCFGRHYASHDQMDAVRTVSPTGGLYVLSGAGVAPMKWAPSQT